MPFRCSMGCVQHLPCYYYFKRVMNSSRTLRFKVRSYELEMKVRVMGLGLGVVG